MDLKAPSAIYLSDRDILKIRKESKYQAYIIFFKPFWYLLVLTLFIKL
jgi:AraC family L-rhamnose operon regulatory protein RhaS